MRIPLDEVVHFDAVTHHPTTGAVTDADSTPTFSVFEEDTDTPIVSAVNLTKRTSLTGNYRGSFTTSAANGFEVGKWYNAIASATVNSIAGKAVAMTFMLVPAEAAAGVAKVDPSHLGGVAQSLLDLKDFADDGYDPSTNKVQGVVLADTLTTYTGNTPQTGDSFARLGAPAGASVSADVAGVKTVADGIKAKTDQLIFTLTNKVDASIQAAGDFVQAAADKVWATAARILTAATNITSTGGTTVPQTGDAYARLGAPVGVSIAADLAAVKGDTAATLAAVDTEVAAILAAIDTEVAAIKAVTDTLSLTAIADAILKRDFAAVTGEAARSALNALRALRNKVDLATTPGSMIVTKEDDATPAWTATLTTDAAAEPITVVDPGVAMAAGFFSWPFRFWRGGFTSAPPVVDLTGPLVRLRVDDGPALLRVDDGPVRLRVGG